MSGTIIELPFGQVALLAAQDFDGVSDEIINRLKTEFWHFLCNSIGIPPRVNFPTGTRLQYSNFGQMRDGHSRFTLLVDPRFFFNAENPSGRYPFAVNLSTGEIRME